MSYITNYLEVCSSNRNRNEFPYQADFDIILGVSYISENQQAVDPIISGVRWFTWQGGSTGASAISSGVIDDSSTNKLIVLTQTQANPLQEIPYGYNTNDPNTILSVDPLYYNGYRITVNTGLPWIPNTYSRIISSYDPSLGAISVNPAFIPGTVVGGMSYYITDPTKLNFPPDTSLNQVHLPLIDAFGIIALPFTQSYNNYYLVDETLSQNDTIVYRKITDYESDLRIATIESEIPGWNYNDIYSIVQYPPNNKYIIQDVNPYTNQITLPSYLTYGTGYFNGQYVFSSGLIATDFSNQQINSTGTVDNAFYILDYSGAPSNILTLSPNLNIILPQINNFGVTGLNDIVSIDNLIRDNFYPLQYSGSIVSQNETVAYEVSLTQLCLPNVILDTGSRIAQYPYVYVQLSPKGSPSFLNKNIIYSNNPNANTALFTVPVIDVIDPETSIFVRIYTNQVQTVKIKPNDSFHFSVFLPDGGLFLPFGEIDFYSPFPPNSFLQIEAVFGFRRLNS